MQSPTCKKARSEPSKASLEALPITVINIAQNEKPDRYSLTCKVSNNSENKEEKEEKGVNNFVVMKASSNSDWLKFSMQLRSHGTSSH
jgi:hypothetical protein